MKTQFSTSDILRIFGFQNERFRQWRDKEYVLPSELTGMGKHRKNVYSRWDIYGIGMFEELLKMNISRDNSREFYRTWQMRTSLHNPEPLSLDFRKNIVALATVKSEADTAFPDDLRIAGKSFAVFIVLSDGAMKPYESNVFINRLNDVWNVSKEWDSVITVNMAKIIARVDEKLG